ncbi:hypothetical protein [Lichenicola sp.]|uniref:hypothetical protein n=1 Tax=Lichenicola sp. TaxID=2804529 RepID=UPI003AFFC001
MLAQLPATDRIAELVVDGTGVGAPVVDAMREMDLHPIAVTITAGREVHVKSGNTVTVPKSVLASSLDITLAEDRFNITPSAIASAAFKAEHRGFDVKIKAGARNESMEAGREGIHDDLVLAAATEIWRGENLPHPAEWIMMRRSVFER